MQTVFATALALALLMAIMAIGVMIKGKALRGSCGGATGACGCSPEKQAKCAAEGKGPLGHHHHHDEEDDDAVTAPPRRLPVLDTRNLHEDLGRKPQ